LLRRSACAAEQRHFRVHIIAVTKPVQYVLFAAGALTPMQAMAEQVSAMQQTLTAARAEAAAATAEATRLRQELFVSKVTVAGLEEQLAAAQAQVQQLQQQQG
jgi:predicted  nucleic acid-binding Zn-ribbon protein